MRQVHLAAFDDGQQVPRLNAVDRGPGHQRVHHRVCGLACKGLADFGLPPGEFGAGHAGVGDFIDHVIDLAAKSIKGGDGGAPVLG